MDYLSKNYSQEIEEITNDFFGIPRVTREEQEQLEREANLRAGLSGEVAENVDFTLTNGQKIEDLEVDEVKAMLSDILWYGLDCKLDERDRAVIKECKRVIALKSGN